MSKFFVKPKPKATRLKMYIYGETGTGKTVTSLQFPYPAVVDTQRGTEHYTGDYNFYRMEPKTRGTIDLSDPDLIELAIDDLRDNPGPFKTFVIDSMTDVYDRMVEKRLHYMRKKKDNPFYELQPQDYGWLKGRVKSFIHKLLSLDMNVIATAESATQYAKDEMMKPIGTKPEGHRKIPYIFDIVIELSKDDNHDDIRWAKVHKDRTNSLPKEFEFSYEAFKKYMDVEGLEREADASKTKQDIIGPSRNHEVHLNGSTVKTAGIEAETLTKIKDIVDAVGEDSVREILINDYNVDSFLDLKEDEGQMLLKQVTS